MQKQMNYTDFKSFRKGVYFVITSTKKTTSDFVFLYQGRCFDSKFSSEVKTLENCTLQKFREITFDEESVLDEKFQLDTVETIGKTEAVEVKKKTEYQMRRDYFKTFDTSRESGKKYTIKNSIERMLS